MTLIEGGETLVEKVRGETSFYGDEDDADEDAGRTPTIRNSG